MYGLKNGIVLVLSLSLILGTAWAQSTSPATPAASTPAALAAPTPAATTPAGPAVATPAAPTAFEPYVALVTGENVNIRSGAASVYYAVGQLNKGQKIIVIGETLGRWAKIVPTPQCFSYVAKEYVRLKDYPNYTPARAPSTAPAVIPAASATATPGAAPAVTTPSGAAPAINPSAAAGPVPPIGKEVLIGEITGDNVRVRYGSIAVPPANANEVQTVLDRGVSVKVIGERDDYYKIVTPANCFFWVALDYIKKQGPASADLIGEHIAQAQDAIHYPAPTRTTPAENTAAGMGNSSRPAITVLPPGDERQEYREIARLLEEQLALPVPQRTFAPIRTRVDKLIASAKSISVKKSAEALAQRLGNMESAQEALRRSNEQDQKLAETLSKIDQNLANLKTSNGIGAPRELSVSGTLAESAVFTAPATRRYKLVNESNEILYYAVNDDGTIDLKTYLSKKVNLTGSTTYESFSRIRLLHVTKLEEMAN